jgi:hypothetical protein
VQVRRALVRTILGALCATVAVAIAALLSSSVDGISGRVPLTTLAVSLYGLLGVPAGALLERNLAPVLAAGTLALARADGGRRGPAASSPRKAGATCA